MIDIEFASGGRMRVTGPVDASTVKALIADVLARLPDHPAKRIHDLLPWNWRRRRTAAEAA